MRFSLIIVILLLLDDGRAIAHTITQTGAQLAVNADAVFPTRTFTTSGSTISFGDGAGLDNDVLMRWKIADAGSITTDTQISVTANVRRDTIDFDVWFGLYDQATWVGGAFTDNDTGTIQARDGSLQVSGTKISASGVYDLSTAPNMFSTGTSGDLKVDVLLLNSTADFAFTFDGTTVNFSRSFNRNADLSIILGLGDFDEHLTLNSMTVSSTAVPEPSSALIMTGVFGVGWIGNRMRRRKFGTL